MYYTAQKKERKRRKKKKHFPIRRKINVKNIPPPLRLLIQVLNHKGHVIHR